MITHNKNNLILWDAFNKTSLGISVGVLVGIYFYLVTVQLNH